LIAVQSLPAVGDEAPGASAQPQQDYLLDAEDVLQITVLDHPELSLDTVTVMEDGSLIYPLIGRLVVRGLSAQQVQQRIVEGLKKELRQPRVTVVLKIPRKQRVYVNGEVGAAGEVDWKPGWRISEAIAAAGGLKIRPELSRTTIFRPGQSPIQVNLEAIYLKNDQSANIALLPGDSITVLSHTIRIYVTGQVRNPKDYEIPVGAGVRQAIAAAGGLLEDAAASRAYVMRGSEKIPINLYKLLEEGTGGNDFPLQALDAIHVPESRDSIAVFGHVKNAGFYPLKDSEHLTVAQALSRAGGTDLQANIAGVVVNRVEDGKALQFAVDVKAIQEQGRLEKDVEVRPGDIILVPAKRKMTPSSVLSNIYGLSVLRALFGGM
jgi:protein involved in polysaccharide export with SLBB domain